MADQSLLLHRNASLSEMADHCRGRLCVMAAPWPVVETLSQSIEASVRAARWLLVFEQIGVSAVCPLVQAVEMVNADLEGCGPDLADPATWAVQFGPLYAAAVALIVPPLPGAADDQEILALARQFTGRNAPVFYLAGQ